MWTCPAAQEVWNNLRSIWQALGLWTTSADDANFRDAVSLRLPRVPPAIWDLPFLRQLQGQDSDQNEVYPTLQSVWQHDCLDALAIIWRWRNGLADNPRDWPTTRALAQHAATRATSLRVLATLTATHTIPTAPGPRILSALLAGLPRMTTTAPDPEAQRLKVLFFDGGSRGNPGPGGSGAGIVEVGTDPGSAVPVWCASMSYAHPSTTNNQAEYKGVIAGLEEAFARGWKGLAVVGDSQLILNQLRHYRPPRNERLRGLYSQARRLADQLQVTNWRHHYRSSNRMADAAANLAMDTATSFRTPLPSTRPALGRILRHVATDVSEWFATVALAAC